MSINLKLIELVSGIREPENGMEKHFLKVITGDGIPCTLEEKEWFKQWQLISLTPVDLAVNINESEAPIEQSKTMSDIDLLKARMDRRYNRHDKLPELLNPNIERMQKEKVNIEQLKVENGPKPEPIVTTAKELLKLKYKGNTSYKIDEGIAGSREDNKKMRGQLWGDMRNRGRGK